jgi:Tfp pilus assembly protein PilP
LIVRALLVSLIAVAAAASSVPAQVKTPAPAPVEQAAAPPPPPDDAYVYQPLGRRDPFLTLLGAGSEPKAPGKRGDGPAGILVSEIAVRGVLESGGTMVAMVQGPDGKNHIIHAGDKFMDGTVKSITRQGLIIVQDVNDPLSLEKRREVRKLLRSAEEARP